MFIGLVWVRDIFGYGVYYFYFFYDLYMVMVGMIKWIKFKVVFIIEVELWFNFIYVCWKCDIFVMVINVRMIDCFVRWYKKIGKFFSFMFNKFSYVCV